MTRLQIENYMLGMLGYHKDDIVLYREDLSDNDLLEVIQQDLDDQPYDFWIDGVRTAKQEVEAYHGSTYTD